MNQPSPVEKTGQENDTESIVIPRHPAIDIARIDVSTDYTSALYTTGSIIVAVEGIATKVTATDLSFADYRFLRSDRQVNMRTSDDYIDAVAVTSVP
jgi:hypothetical protein